MGWNAGAAAEVKRRRYGPIPLSHLIPSHERTLHVISYLSLRANFPCWDLRENWGQKKRKEKLHSAKSLWKSYYFLEQLAVLKLKYENIKQVMVIFGHNLSTMVCKVFP